MWIYTTEDTFVNSDHMVKVFKDDDENTYRIKARLTTDGTFAATLGKYDKEDIRDTILLNLVTYLGLGKVFFSMRKEDIEKQDVIDFSCSKEGLNHE